MKDLLAAGVMEIGMAGVKAATRDAMTAVETDSRSVDWSDVGWAAYSVARQGYMTAADWAALMDEQWAAWKGLVMDARNVGTRDSL